MQNCVYCKKQMMLRVILTVLDIKPAEIARELHISKSLVSKYIAGERTSTELDVYFIERIFFIQVKDFSKNEQ